MVGGSATGNVEYNYDTDWFAVDLEAGKTYRFDLEGSSTGGGTLRDPALTGIYDSEGRRSVGYHDEGGVDRNSRAYFTPDEGATYYVSAGAFSIYQGTYTLAVTEVSDDSADDPNYETVVVGGSATDDYADDYADDSTTTGTVVVGGSVTGNVEHTHDRDWFAVDLEAGKLYRFDLEGRPTGGGTLRDPYLRGIYDEDGDRIDGTTDDDGGWDYNSRVYFRPDEGATYYVSAGGYSNAYSTYTLTLGTYTLAVTEVSDDYAADPATTGTVVVGGSATGDIDPPGDRDWFAVDLEAGKTYRFDLEGSWTDGGTLRNPYLRGIYDANGDRIDGTTNDDGGWGRNSRVYFTPDEDATYYVSAGAYGNHPGTYTLAVTEVSDDYAADPATTGTVMVGVSATGDIDPPGDRDWFAVDLEAGKAYRFDLEGTWSGGGTLYDPYLRGIYDEDGDRIDRMTDDDGGVGRNSRVDFTPDESATYYVSAGADRNYTGTYTLSVEEVDAM